MSSTPRGPCELLDRLRGAPTGRAAEAESEAKGHLVRALVRVLEPLVTELQQLTAAVEHTVAVHPDGAVLMSFPRAGKVSAAQILAEAARWGIPMQQMLDPEKRPAKD